MAGSQREYELLFKLKASLGGNFNGTFKNAVDAQKRLSDSIKSVNTLQSKIDGYTKATNAIEKNRGKVEDLTAEHDRLQSELQETARQKKALQKAMETAEADGNIEEYKRLQSELTATQREYGRLNDKLKGNQSQIQQTAAKIEEQKNALNELTDELQQAGVNTDNLEEANGRLQRSYERLQSTQATLQKVNERQAAVQQSIAGTKTQLLGTVGAITAAAGSFFALDAATEEYRNNQAKLNTAYQAAGMTVKDAQEAYTRFYKILGDNDTATEASQLLAKLALNNKDIAKWTDIAAGIYGTFGDSLPIEGLIEAANETARVGQVTGVFADAINWAAKEGETFGVALKENTKANEEWNKAVMNCKSAEDYFNLALQSCSTEAERNRLIMDTLQGSYKDATAAYYENNKQILQNRQAQVVYNNILADVGRIAGTVKGSVLEMLGITTDGTVKAGSVIEKVQGIVSKLANNPELVKTIAKVVAGLAALRVGMLGAKLAGLSAESGLLSLVGKLVGLRAGFLSNAASSVSFAAKLKTAGSGILSYFGNVGSALGGVGSALGNILFNNPLMKGAGAMFTKLGGKFTAGATSLAGKFLGPIASVGTKALGLITRPFSLLGGKLGSLLGGLGKIIAKSPLGTIGKFVAAGFSKLGTVIAPVGKLLKTALGPLGKLGTSLLGPLGGIAGKILPVVGIVTAVITVVQLLRENFDEVRAAIGRIFGEGGLAVFDKIVSAVTAAGDAIKNVFSDGNLGNARAKIEEIFGSKGVAVFDGFIGVVQTVQGILGSLVGFITEHIVPVAEQVLSVIVTSVIPGILNGISQAAPVIMQIVQSIADFIGGIVPIIGQFIAGIMPVISEIITFIQTYVFPIVSEIFNFIVAEVLPFIVQGVQNLASTITMVLSQVLPVVQTVFSTIWGIIQPILQQILTTVQAVLPSVLQIFRTTFSAIGSVISAITQIFSGLIQFITGVFSGNWSAAWEGIKSIFQGAWDGLVGIAKGVINGVIGIINGAISALNSIKIPDWVPGVGGKGINIPTLPTFAKGTSSTPDTFIAGEEGPELITNAPGRVVYTADQTRQIMERTNQVASAVHNVQNITNNAAPADVGGLTPGQIGQIMGRTQLAAPASSTEVVKTAPEVKATSGGGGAPNITIHNAPTIVVNGDNPGDLEEKLEANNQKLLQEFDERIRQKEDDERRSEYE